MKALFITMEYGDSAGGLAFSSKKTAELFKEMGITVFLEKISLSLSDNIISGGYDKTLKERFSVAISVDNIVSTYKAENVNYVIAYGGGKNAELSTIIAKKLKTKLIVVLCGTDINLSLYHGDLRESNRFAFEYASSIVAKSQEMLDNAKSIYFNAGCNYCLIPNFYDNKEYPCFKSVNLERIAFATGAKYLNEKKGIYALIRGFGRFLEKYNRNDQLYLYGKIDKDLLIQYEKYVKDNMLESNVIFESDFERSEYQSILKTKDVYIQSSFYEGCPNSLMDAVDAGMYVLSTNTGFFAEILEAKFPNSLCNNYSENSIADSLCKFVEWISKKDERLEIFEAFHSATEKSKIIELWNNVFKIKSESNLLDENKLNAVMFHDVNNRFSGVDYPVTAFRELALMVKNNGYRYVSMKDYIASKHREKLIVCTFDDAYESVYHNAYPILRELGFTATIFVNVELMGMTNDWNTKDECIRVHATLDMLKEMHNGGMEIGSHSLKHICLNRLSQTELEDTLKLSKIALEEQFGNISTFCYPYGAFNDYVKNKVSQYYDYAFSVTIGGTDEIEDKYQLVRMVPEELRKRLKK